MLKEIWLHTVRAYIRLGLFFYYKKIHTVNFDNIPQNKPVLILANHQNALLDALIIATKTKQFSYFLTRASVFNSPLISHILKSLRMIPVYRIRDGIKTITKNHTIFKTCSNLLNNNESVVIFPEGNHNLKRTVRPLSKGFTRIIFESLQENPSLELQLVPVGLNYKHAEKFVDEVSVYVGDPIVLSEFTNYEKNEAVLKLKDYVHQSLSKLTSHIPSDDYESVLKKLDALHVDFLKPKSVNSCISNDFKECLSKKTSKFKSFKTVLLWFLKLNILLPYAVWKLLLEPKIKEIEFVSTFRFVVVITLVPLYLLIITWYLVTSLGVFIGLIYLLLVLALALIAVKV
ncbi:lysophospholipid acyltransferase family protein [Yeosuana marina]|uniref:lysophospholipid acyltransferase family protein n=1 Tax=Yeosuana marina TaxID=1565536 RepID=UPI0030EDB570